MKHLAFPAVVLMLVLNAYGNETGSLLQRVPKNASDKANPLARKPNSARAGEKLYVRECAGCHGRLGEGYGKAPPLKSREVFDAPAGALYWVLRNGSVRRGMPSFAHIPEPERWQIITYLQTVKPK